jgi:hypothetical protein
MVMDESLAVEEVETEVPADNMPIFFDRLLSDTKTEADIVGICAPKQSWSFRLAALSCSAFSRFVSILAR